MEGNHLSRAWRASIRRLKALGRKRAAYWRALGFPNLVKARKVSARNCSARKEARLFAQAKLRNPFAPEKTGVGFDHRDDKQDAKHKHQNRQRRKVLVYLVAVINV